VDMLNDYETVLTSIISEYNSATTNQKSYINKTLNGEMGYISKKLSQVQYMLNILSDEAILVQSQSVPGFTAFPNSGSRYPSGRNRY
jgi:hypothetical protein